MWLDWHADTQNTVRQWWPRARFMVTNNQKSFYRQHIKEHLGHASVNPIDYFVISASSLSHGCYICLVNAGCFGLTNCYTGKILLWDVFLYDIGGGGVLCLQWHAVWRLALMLWLLYCLVINGVFSVTNYPYFFPIFSHHLALFQYLIDVQTILIKNYQSGTKPVFRMLM